MTSAILRYFARMRAWASSIRRISVSSVTSPTGAATAKFARGCIRPSPAMRSRRVARIIRAGSFFWARTRYLQPLFDLELTDTDFPEEMSQSDGALAHAVERMIGLLDKPTGMVKQCVSVTPPLFSRRSGRNGQWLSRIVRTCDRAAPYRAASAPGLRLGAINRRNKQRLAFGPVSVRGSP